MFHVAPLLFYINYIENIVICKRKNLNRIASIEVFCGATGLQT